MPMEIQYLPDGGIFLKGTGIIKSSDIREMNEKLYAIEDKIVNIFYQLCDLTDIESHSITTEEIKTIAEQDIKASALNKNMIIAVVGKKDITYGLLRMWQAYASNASITSKVFRNLEDAKKWIEGQLHTLPKK